MGTRGPKSKAELSVISGDITEIIPRPPAPRDLTDEQAEEWNAIVARMPADWFQRETHQMLKAFCRHVAAAGRVAQLINAQDGAESVDVEEYDRLLKMQEREGRAMSSLATRMRISQQSSYDLKMASTAKNKPSSKKLWDG